MFFNRNKTGSISWLVVGLGNPGSKYENTRHNMGFLALDILAEKEKLKFNKLRFKAWTATAELGGEKVLVMKPQTYMNLSGESVGEAARFYKIPPEHVLVISDDISIGAGKLRIRPSGSAGGHNGLKSIIQHLGSDQFPRIKVGVGSPQHAEHDIVDWVIGKPMGEDAKVLTQALERAAEAVSAVIAQGPQKAMNKYNG
ncbi:MAG: aminoacyl-tRNA hydrolase [Oscillospiraceae bacterium]|nr:aminoacyl-tRNA hydrolase [Oscillospiraceae bacterium]